MQDKYELRVTLTNSTAINILKGLNNYGIKRQFIENAIVRFAKGNDKIQIDLYGQSHRKELNVSRKENSSETKKLLLQHKKKQQVGSFKKEIPQLKSLEKKQEEQKPTTESQSCFMFDFGGN